MSILEIDNVELNYGVQTILNAIYLKAETGKVTGILGRNGCGKTSLLKIIFGSLSPKNKLIRLNHKPIIQPLYKKGYIKYLPQFNIIPKNMSLKKAFSYFDVTIEDFFTDFPDFTAEEKTLFRDLSGGERRIIETYLTLKTSSKIVLLDEPFSQVAPIFVEKIKELIDKEKSDKIILITDHYYKEIMDVSDTIYLIKNGWCKLIKNKEDLKFHKYIY